MAAVRDRGSGGDERVEGTGSGPVLEEELVGLANAGLLLREESKMTGHFLHAEERGRNTVSEHRHARLWPCSRSGKLRAPLPWEILSSLKKSQSL